MKKIISIALVMVTLFTLFSGTISASAAVGDNTKTEVESNNTMSLADRIYNDYTVSGTVNASRSDLDYFKFTLSSSAQVQIVCISDYSSLLMGIWNSSDDCVAAATYLGYSDGGNAQFSITKTLSAGTYYVVLFDEDDYGYNDYMFYFTYTTYHTHSYSSRVVYPTCASQGYTEYTCSCGDSYNSNYTSATGEHTISDSERIDAQTHEGYCTVCNDYIEENHIYTDILDTTCNKCDNTRAAYTGTTLAKNINGEWIYVKNGAYSTDTTLVKYNNEWWYVKNGKLCRDNTLFKYNGQWYHVNNGKWVKDTTLVKYNNTWYYVKDGRTSSATTLVKYNNEWWYVKDGKLNRDNTLVKYNNEWWYVKDGRLNRDNTLFKYNGQWYHVNNGKWVKDTTLVKYNNTWYYVKDGRTSSATTLVKYNNEWWYVKDGKLNRDNTLVKYNGQWYHVNGGKWVKDTTLVKYNGKYYYVSGGRVNFGFTGNFNFNGKIYAVKKGVA